MSRGTIQLYHLYGLMPIGDTPRSRMNWWLHTDIETKKAGIGEPWSGPDTEPARPYSIANLEKREAEVARVDADPAAKATELIGAAKTRRRQTPIIDALANNNGGFFQVNAPKNGALAGVADDVVVETPAWIDRMGIHPLRVTPLPRRIMLEMEREVEAFKTGDRTNTAVQCAYEPAGALIRAGSGRSGGSAGHGRTGGDGGSLCADHHRPSTGLRSAS